MKHDYWGRWRNNFVTGMIVLLPGVVTLALLKWIFGTVSSVTDGLLIWVPREITHQQEGRGEMWWYWSVVALAIAAFLVALVGLLTRYVVGKRIIKAVDSLALRVPLLNKVYGTIKQVNEAFSSDQRSSFRTVVMVEFPRKGLYSIGFLTSEQHDEVQAKTREKVVCVFVPTTPNPTTGFLVLVPEHDVTKLEMSVADGIRFVISLGSVSPHYTLPGAQPAAAPPPPPPGPAAPATAPPPPA